MGAAMRELLKGITMMTVLDSDSVLPDDDCSVGIARATLNTRCQIFMSNEFHVDGGIQDDDSDPLKALTSAPIFDHLHVVTVNTIISVCGSHGLLDEAEALLVEMEVLCARRLVTDIANVSDELLNSGFHVDEQLRPIVLKVYIAEGLLVATMFSKCMNYQLWPLVFALGLTTAVIVRVSNELGVGRPTATVFCFRIGGNIDPYRTHFYGCRSYYSKGFAQVLQ
ncbi:hypothetical protein J5N97_024846 [Dioscorea zingiberensis]|uniref:Pentatricopeptide repeat-containing protein n=1 Tax=Dioscorea zingiberensis TaxID=325984 RepID=A0A9D5C7N6_9LILI|nr:hypothetical protein J5N97_024846 [Dioscorea zingiberensis]